LIGTVATFVVIVAFFVAWISDVPEKLTFVTVSVAAATGRCVSDGVAVAAVLISDAGMVAVSFGLAENVDPCTTVFGVVVLNVVIDAGTDFLPSGVAQL
jgi:hypothetical protein